MKPICQPGDLAIVISAVNPENIGRIVKVLRRHVPSEDISIRREPLVWDIEGQRPMVWAARGRRYRRMKGPVPDRCLWPIREQRRERDTTVEPAEAAA